MKNRIKNIRKKIIKKYTKKQEKPDQNKMRKRQKLHTLKTTQNASNNYKGIITSQVTEARGRIL